MIMAPPLRRVLSNRKDKCSQATTVFMAKAACDRGAGCVSRTSRSKLHEKPAVRVRGLSRVVHTCHLSAREAEGKKIRGLKSSMGYIARPFLGKSKREGKISEAISF